MTALVRIVLIDPSHPGNIGSVARAIKNMAVTDLVLVRPRSFPHAEANALAAGSGDVEHFYAHLHQVLGEIDFDDRTGHLMERLRRLFNRAQLDRNELTTLR